MNFFENMSTITVKDIKNIIEDMSVNDILTLHNYISEQVNDKADYIYHMKDFPCVVNIIAMNNGLNPNIMSAELLDAINYSLSDKFSCNDNYCYCDVNGMISSGNAISCLNNRVDIDILARDVLLLLLSSRKQLLFRKLAEAIKEIK